MKGWNYLTGEMAHSLRVFPDSHFVTTVKMMINDALLAGSSEGSLARIDGEMRERIDVQAGLTRGIKKIEIGFDPSKALVATEDSRVHMLDLEKEKVISQKVFEGHADAITDIFAFYDRPQFITS